jgi:hypothetical protein
MSAVKIVLGEGSNELTLDSNVSFTVQVDAVANPAGQMDTVTRTYAIRGDVVDATAGSVWDSLLELEDRVGDASGSSLGPQRFRVYLDDVLKRDFTVAGSIGSPIIESFRTFDEPGAGHGHWRYEMVVVIRQAGGGAGQETPQNVLEFSTSLAITTEDDKVVRKVWRVFARAATADAAEAAVRGYRPSSVKKNLVGTVEKFNEESRATGVWVWELDKEFGLEETIEELGFGQNQDYAVNLQVGENAGDRPAPTLTLLPKGVKTITVRGTVFGPETPLATPSPHYQDSATLRSLRARTRVFPTVINPGGGFKRDYEEVYYNLADNTPMPDHGDHAQGVKKAAPGDGKL